MSNILYARRALPSPSLCALVHEGVAEVDEPFHLVRVHGTVEKDGEPIQLVHVIGGKETLPGEQRGGQFGRAFEDEDVVEVLSPYAEAVAADIHDYAVPFAAGMAEDGVLGEIHQGCSGCVPYSLAT